MYDLFMAFLGVLFDLDIAMILLGVLGFNILMIMWMTCAFGFLVAIMFIFHDGIWYYFGVLLWISCCLWIISG